MKNATRGWSIAVLVIFLLEGASCETNDDDEIGMITEWQGSTPHFALKGSLNGEDLDIELTSVDAADLTKHYCAREYDVPKIEGTEELDWANGSGSEVELTALVKVNGKARDLQIDFKDHDFTKDAPGTELTVVPDIEDLAPGPNELRVEVEWYVSGGIAADLDATYEEAAQSGKVIVELFGGEVGDNGLTIPDNEGTFGVFADLTWSETEHLTISLTANCGKNDI